jgi:hypothetical protein
MAAIYDPGPTSALLTGAAAKLKTDDPSRDAWARVAERLLGLLAPVFADAADVQDAKDAVAMQITHLMTAGPSAFVSQSESRGAISITYRGEITFSPVAVMLATAVLRRNRRNTQPDGFNPDWWPTVRSARSTDATSGDVGERSIQPRGW